jgi:predicted restriction endonuclease
MPVVHICRHCRQRYTGQRCPCRPPKRGIDPAARKAQAEFRAALLAASDGRCAFSDANGRCTRTENLEAAHAGCYSTDGNFTAGAMLCALHHRMFDRSRHG